VIEIAVGTGVGAYLGFMLGYGICKTRDGVNGVVAFGAVVGFLYGLAAAAS
jgi:hypothetical protein